MYVSISKLTIVLQIKENHVSFYSSIQKMFSSHFLPQTLVSAGSGTTYRMFTESTQISSLFLGSQNIEPIDRVPACSSNEILASESSISSTTFLSYPADTWSFMSGTIAA